MEYIEDTPAGIYRITSDGKVFSQSKLKIPLVAQGMAFTGSFKLILKPERELKYTLNNRGYYSVGIHHKTFMVHRLIAKAFIPNPFNKPFVNHIDGVKTNNAISNLEWCTCAENNAHARSTGLHVQAVGHSIQYRSPLTKQKALANLKDTSKLSSEDVKYVRSVFKARDKQFSATALALKFGTSVTAMCKIVNGLTYQNI